MSGFYVDEWGRDIGGDQESDLLCLECDQCGKITDEQHSEQWQLASGGDITLLCHECAPPDQD